LLSAGGTKLTGSNQVVLVEDSRTQAQAIAMYLGEYGLEVIVRDDGPAGIAAVIEYHPAAVILDVNLPTMNGYQIARHLKRHPGTADIPVIMLTKLDGTANVVQGLNHGADHYIHKGPDAADDLYKTLCAFGIITWR
jgi:DNA-binding response OmpR family regulator